jgi:hypothetical protein
MPLPENAFEAQYDVEDGYVTGGRPQTFEIYAEDLKDLEDDPSNDALREFYDNQIRVHFENNEKIYPSSRREDKFIAWAKAQIAERKAAELDEAREFGLTGPE